MSNAATGEKAELMSRASVLALEHFAAIRFTERFAQVLSANMIAKMSSAAASGLVKIAGLQ